MQELFVLRKEWTRKEKKNKNKNKKMEFKSEESMHEPVVVRKGSRQRKNKAK